MRVITATESKARVQQLRRLGYKVKVVTLPNGAKVILTSKKRFVCRANHCTWVNDGGAKNVAWKRK